MNERMAIALRVLTTITNNETPDHADIESLQSWVDLKDRKVDLDKLACIVIGAEMQRRKNSIKT